LPLRHVADVLFGAVRVATSKIAGLRVPVAAEKTAVVRCSSAALGALRWKRFRCAALI
jgi:hypothetical protein